MLISKKIKYLQKLNQEFILHSNIHKTRTKKNNKYISQVFNFILLH